MKLKIGILHVNHVQKMKLKIINTTDMVAPGKGSRFFFTPKVFHIVFLPFYATHETDLDTKKVKSYYIFTY